MSGEVVAMMGDGINDTPALKKAEIGIVVDNATDFSKEVADIVLLDSDFKTIISAISEGRNIFENMRKVITYLLSGAFNALILVVGSLILGIPVPLLPLQILYINFLADGLPDVALSFERPEHELMRDRPKPKNYPLLDRQVITMVAIIGFVVSLVTLALYVIILNQGVSVAYARSLVMLTVGINSLAYVFSIKSFKKNIWQMDLLDNKFMLVGTLVGIAGLLLAIYNPLVQNLLGTVAIVYSDWLIVLGLTFSNLLLIEFIKSRFQAKNELSTKK
jgi:Ca2+-transporting ATPase